MSAKFNALLTDSEWAAFNAGRLRAQREAWMHDAREAKRRGYALSVTTCVDAARQRNHEFLQRVAEYRALPTPQRKRA